MKTFLATDSVKLNDTFEKKIEMVEIVRGSGFVREGDEFNSYSQFQAAYGEGAEGIDLQQRRKVENYLSRIGLYFVEDGDTKIITKVGDPVGNLLYDFYLANDEPAISRMTNIWQGENREKINQFLKDKPWEKVEGRLQYSDYGFSQSTASALFSAMPQTRLFEITEADFEVKLPEGSLWTIDRIYKVVGNKNPKRADITCVCGKQMKMYRVDALENGRLSCQSCAQRTTDFDAFYTSIKEEGYVIVKDFQDERPTSNSRIWLQCPQKCEPYETHQHKWTNQGKRCPGCSFSVGEKKVAQYLDEKGVEYRSQVKFDGLIGIGGRQLSYDFEVELNGKKVLIEIDGGQHFKSVEAWGGETKLQEQIEHDRRKTDYALQKGLRLVRIQNVNSDYDFIENSLEELLSGSTANHYGNLYQKEG